nr:unnamed protein product [Digitaria exilis]
MYITGSADHSDQWRRKAWGHWGLEWPQAWT